MFSALTSLLAGGALLAQVGVVPPRFTIATERRVERVRYHFDNPSNFDTVELVPHFYEQKYDADNLWMLLTAEYRFLGGRARTQAGLTPRVTTQGSDIDSFFQTSGDVVTSGTDGQVRLNAFSIDQRFRVAYIGRVTAPQWKVDVVMAYRRAHASFLPADIIVTHSLPASTTATFTTDRESTVSRMLQSGVAIEREWWLPGDWSARLESDAMPITRARLTTSLPDKYDYDVVSDAWAFGATARLTFERRWSAPLVTGVTISSGGAWGYRGSANFQDRLFGVSVFVRYPQ
jgi:hypothetical protein